LRQKLWQWEGKVSLIGRQIVVFSIDPPRLNGSLFSTIIYYDKKLTKLCTEMFPFECCGCLHAANSSIYHKEFATLSSFYNGRQQSSLLNYYSVLYRKWMFFRKVPFSDYKGIQSLYPFSETNFQNFSRTQIDFSRILKFTLTLHSHYLNVNSPYCLPYISCFFTWV